MGDVLQMGEAESVQCQSWLRVYKRLSPSLLAVSFCDLEFVSPALVQTSEFMGEFNEFPRFIFVCL